jgi:exosortase/archaeosortase family protein
VGRRVFLRVLPAIAALALVLPVPGRIRLMVAGPLQEWSAQIAQFVLDLFGTPVLRSGNVLAINGVDVTIAEACNGMRMVSALAVITYAFVFSMPLRPAARLGLIAASPIIALLLNVIRLIPTVLFYGYSDPDTAEAFHDFSGWGSLFVAIALLLGVTSLLRWLEVPIDPAVRRAPVAAAQPGRRQGLGSVALWASPAAAAGMIVAVVVLGGFKARGSPGVTAYHVNIRKAVSAMPYRIQGSLGIDQAVSPGVERILSPNAMLQRRFTDPASGRGFGLMVIHCGDVRDLVDHYPPVCYPANGWIAQGASHHTFKIGEIAVPARLYEFSRQTQEAVIRTRVLSFFVLPGKAGVVDSMDAVEVASRSTVAAALGAAHIMVSFSGNETEAEIVSTVQGVLEPLEATIRTTLGGTAGE